LISDGNIVVPTFVKQAPYPTAFSATSRSMWSPDREHIASSTSRPAGL